MPCSEARLAANRANALKSTGPVTAEGKEISRRNSFKHGLTGAGIVIPGEDAAEVNRRRAAFEAELAPGRSATALFLAQRVAALAVRLDRSVRYDSARTADRVEAAVAAARADREAEAAELLAGLAADPVGTHAALRARPEGVDLLLRTLGALRPAVQTGSASPLTEDHAAEVSRCFAEYVDDPAATRLVALARALVAGDFAPVDPAWLAGIDPEARGEWARAQLGAGLDAEIARLEAHRATFDPALLEEADARAANLALVDAGPEAVLTRKYEAATERSIFRALGELRPYRVEPPRAVDATATRQALATSLAHLDRPAPAEAPLGSFFPDPAAAPSPRAAAEITTARAPARPQSRFEDRKQRPRVPR